MKGHVRRKGGKFQYMFTGEPDPLTGKRRQITKSGFDTEKAAWAACHKAMADYEAGFLVRTNKRTVEQLITECLTRRQHAIKPSMLANYRTYARAYVLPHIGHRTAQDLTAAVFDALYDKLLTAGRVKAQSNRRKTTEPKQATRGRRGPAPKPKPARSAPPPGLAPKTVVNVHRMLHMVWEFGVKQGYLKRNVVADASPPRVPRKARRTWTIDQLTAFLLAARTDRFYALWVLEATTGMRRCELAGARRDGIDFDTGILRLWKTRVVVDGQVQESDGKTDGSWREIALDPYTLAALRMHLEMLDVERAVWGPDYHDHGLLFCWPDGRPPHPDTITARFNRLVDQAGLPRIHLHEVRHSYLTAGRRARLDPKALSQRAGHAAVSFTMETYMHGDPEADRELAHQMAALILAGLPPIPGENRT